MNDHSELATERLVLRPLAPGQAVALHEIYPDAEAMRFWHVPPHRHVDETRAMIDALVSGTERAWALLQRGGGGAMSLVYYLDNVGRPGMGYILNPRYWGKDGEAVLHQVQLEQAHVFGRGRLRRSLQVRRKPLAGAHVAPLRLLAGTARRHVLDNALSDFAVPRAGARRQGAESRRGHGRGLAGRDTLPSVQSRPGGSWLRPSRRS